MKLTNAIIVAWIVFFIIVSCGVPAYCYEVSYYKDSNIGVFKVAAGALEIKNHPPASIVPVYDGAVLSEVYTFDSRTEKRDGVYVDDAEKKEKDKNRARMDELNKQQSELYKERSDLSEDSRFLEKFIERADKGELKIEQSVLKDSKAKIAFVKEEIKKLDELISALNKEIDSLYEQSYNYKTRNITKKELNEDIKFYVYGRFFKPGETALKLVNAESGEIVLEIKLNLIDREDKTERQILDKWLAVAKNYFMKLRSGSAESVFSYIAAQSERRFTHSSDEALISRKNLLGVLRSGGGPDLYSMSSGMLAIQEALQLDRMTGELTREGGAQTAVQSLKGPEIKSHPFELMLGGKTPKTYPMDALIPSDFYYLHFSNINDQIAFSDLMDKWGTNFLHLMQVSSTDSMIKEKYLGQLCLKMSELTRLFGDKVIDDMAVCGNDPFLDDGTDISVIFSVKNKAVFDLNVSRYFMEAKSSFKDIKDETSEVSGFKMRAFYTPDGAVSSYSCYINDFMVYSNSRAAVLKIIDAYKNPRKSMAETDDYLYMRTVYEADAGNESAFLYLSDAHIRKLVGPEFKIARQRRLNCAASLRMINNAVTLYKMDKKADHPSLETLIAGGYLEEKYIFCPDGGTYWLSGETLEPCCSKHRRLRYMTPASEMIPQYATGSESSQYIRFVREYNNYWTKFFDPVGIRIKNTPKRISLETCILPLVENSIYNWLSDACGGAAAKFYDFKVPSTIFSLRAKINTKHENIVKFFASMLSSTSFTTDRFLNFIGKNASIHLLDSDIRFTLDPMMDRMLAFMGRESFIIFGSVFLCALNHPLYLMIEVSDMREAESFVIELIKFIEAENNKNTSGFLRSDFFAYRVRPNEAGLSIYTLNFKLFLIGINLHLMIHDNQLIIATKRSILSDILKNSATKKESSESNFELEINSADFGLISQTYNIVWGEKMRKACHSNLWPIYVLNRLRGVEMSAIKDASLLVGGYFPYCPAGGEYKYDEARGVVYCTQHGGVYDPKQPAELDGASELVKFFKGLKKIRTALTFSVHGIMTEVVIERE
jgi:hypothetical protein